MKKWIGFLLILVMGLGACSPGQTDDGGGETAVSNTTNTQTASANSSTRLSDDYTDALSAQAQLALGTLQLEETDLAVDETLAAEILPLWQAVQSLSQSDATAEAEVTAVLNQIQDTMTSEQIAAIAAMQLTGDDVQTYMEEVGFGLGARGDAGQGGRQGGFGGGGAAGGFAGGPPGGGGLGGPPAGGFAGGGQGGFGGANFEDLSEDEIADLLAARMRNGDQLMVPLINLLRVKTGEEVQVNPFGGRGGFMGLIAEATGLSIEEIQTQTAAGKTLADIVTENGGDLDTVRSQLIEQFSNAPNTDATAVEQQVDDLLNGGGG